MLKFASLLFVSTLMLSGCALYVPEEDYAMAARNEYVLKYSGLEASKDSLHSKTLQALQERRWIIEDDGNPIKAKIVGLRKTTVASFDVSQNAISVDTKGSMVDGNKPFVPKRYVDNVMASVRKLLRDSK